MTPDSAVRRMSSCFSASMLWLLVLLAPAAHAVAPAVTIDAPSDGSSFAIGSNVSFTGSATDAEDDDAALTAAIVWTSSLDGGIGSGGSFSTSSLSAGTHTITASVTDSEALSDADAINITITNNAPSVTISSPLTGSSFAIGANISFSGNATDTEDGTLTASLSWTSSIDGGIGSGGSFSTSSLSAGTHTITASVTDSNSNPGSDSITVTVTNNAPTVNIASPGDGSSFAIGANISFSGNATDTEDGTLTASLSWTSSIDGGIGSGGSFSTSSLSAGTHTITASVTDSNSNPGSDSITVTVTNNAPSVTISSPLTGSSFPIGTNISFQASGSDVEDNNGQITNSISWTSSIDGSIGNGGNFNRSSLSAGTHTITASATDSDGNPGSDSVTITVTNSTPTVNITQPSSGSSFAFGTNINFVATATDAEDGNLASSIGWSSNIDGSIGSGGSINVNDLSVGSHTITATVTDSDSNTGSDSIAVTVNNNAPTVTITSPSNGASFAAGTTINFVGSATDAEDDNATLTAAIAWSSSLDGSLGTGGSINVSDLSIGNHTITASVTDSDGGPGSDSISVSVTNSAPTANAQSVSTNEDTTLPIVLTGSDPEGGSLTFAIASQPGNGSLTGSPPNVTYTPDANYNGSDSFTFTVSDGQLTSAAATIAITVNPVNDPPVANDDTANVEEDSTNNIIPVTANDTDEDDDALTVTTASASNGTATPSGGNVTYTPNPDFNGQETINYTISDGNGGTDSAVVTVTVASVEDPPQAVNDAPPAIDEGGTINGTFNVLDNDINPESTPMSAVIESGPSNASSFALNGDGTFVYAHNGSETTSDSFTYRANNGAESENVATVSITINPVNDAPTIIGVVAPLSTAEDTPTTIRLADLVISDPDNVFPTDFTLVIQDGLNYTRSGINGNTITPAENFNGTLTIPATVSDLEPLASDVFNIPVIVTSENDVPSADLPIGPQTAIENTPFELNVSGSFSDADGDALTFSATGLPLSLSIDTDTGVITGTPRFEDARDNEPYPVIVTAQDPLGAFATDEFDLTVSALDRANLALLIEVNSNSAAPSEDLRWTFSAINPVGPQPGQDVELVGNFVGTGLTVTAETGANCTIDPPAGNVTSFVCVLGALPVGATLSTVLTSTTSQASEVVAFATAAGRDNLPIDPNEDDNSSFEAAGVAEAFSNGAVQILGAATVRAVTAGDLNGDGRADIVVGTQAGQRVQIFFGDVVRETCDCPRDFIGAAVPVGSTAANDGVALADFDGNGSLDLVVANDGGLADLVYFNDGTGAFDAQPAFNLGTSFAQGVAVGDFNGDGFADIVIAAVGGNPVYLGNGAGGFTLEGTLGTANSSGVAVADFDGNGLDDVVFANVGGPSQVWLRNSGGGFGAGSALLIGDASSVVAADLNGAGGPDLVFGRVPGDVADIPSNPVLLNDGSGGFGAPAQLLGFSPTSDVEVGDFNGDGLPDLVFINASGVHQIWTAGPGGYTLHREQLIDGGARAGVVADLGYTDNGNPGGSDLAMGGASSAGIGVFLNDGSGNLGRGDAVPPVLTLVGNAAIEIDSGVSYRDAGATALDNIDGDITGDIAVTGTVNTAVVGNYTLTYNVSDFAGNPALSVTRTVTVAPAAGTGGGGGGSVSVGLLALLTGLLVLLHIEGRSRVGYSRSRSKNTRG